IMRLWNIAFLLGISIHSGLAWSKVGPEEATKLGKELTPVGAERAGNADGSIPVWTPAQRRGKTAGEYSSDPVIDAEKPLFAITKANMGQYADKLSAGNKELLRRYPDTYSMQVYPSHRVMAFPEEIYRATHTNAGNCELIGTDIPNNCTLGFPFPIPQSGAEVIWNHKIKWRGERVTRYNNQMIVQLDGTFQLTKIIEDAIFPYSSVEKPGTLVKGGATGMVTYVSETTAPPRMAGQLILALERPGTGTEGRVAYLYNVGLRRLRRAPTVCCDNPYEGTDGHQFYDQVDMFNGVLDGFTWKLAGKKEIYVGYNAHKISGPSVKFKDLAAAKHLNQSVARYELHRVWVVEAINRPEKRHTFKKKVFYVDEDSWNIVAIDDYDHRDQLMQFQEGHFIVQYNILAGATVPEVIYHFDSGRYFVTAMANEDKPNNFDVTFSSDYFTPAAVTKKTTR
ncbi:MAG: DUF1329 domain-containing protein, partial [Methyloceanibacter sp.]